MDENTKYSIVMVIVTLCLVVLAFGIVKGIEAIQCHAQTANIGYPSKWGLFSKCLIEITPGQWIPLSAYYYRGK